MLNGYVVHLFTLLHTIRVQLFKPGRRWGRSRGVFIVGIVVSFVFPVCSVFLGFVVVHQWYEGTFSINVCSLFLNVKDMAAISVFQGFFGVLIHAIAFSFRCIYDMVDGGTFFTKCKEIVFVHRTGTGILQLIQCITKTFGCYQFRKFWDVYHTFFQFFNTDGTILIQIHCFKNSTHSAFKGIEMSQ